LETISVYELIWHLKPSEEWINHSAGRTVAGLNLMEEELVVHVSLRLKVIGTGISDQSKESSPSSNKRRNEH
jgi:hypothetical protein